MPQKKPDGEERNIEGFRRVNPVYITIDPVKITKDSKELPTEVINLNFNLQKGGLYEKAFHCSD